MTMILLIASAVASPGVSNGAAVTTKATPFASGRNAVLKNETISAGTVLVQTAGVGDSAFATPTTVATITPTSLRTNEITLDAFIRYSVTGAVTGTLTILLEGVQ